MNTTSRRSSVRIASAASQRRLKPEPEPAVKKFFKIILLSTIKEKMMKIPERFVRLGPKLSDIVTIETPIGFKRSIRIKRTGDEVWFENGWNEFAEAHSLREGFFLYFHYKGNSTFSVMIFDVTASEIDYPMDKVYVIESDDEVMEVVDDDDSSEGVIDLDELLKKTRKVSIKSEKVITIDDDDVEEIDSKNEAEEDKRVLKRTMTRFPSSAKVVKPSKPGATPVKGLLTSMKESFLSIPTTDAPPRDVNLTANLYTALRKLRTVIVRAETDGVMEYHICSNATLQQISMKIPRTKEELLEINGLGKAVLSKYGDRLLETIESTVKEYYGTNKKDSNISPESGKRRRDEEH